MGKLELYCDEVIYLGSSIGTSTYDTVLLDRVEPMTTDEFPVEDAELTRQDLSDWENHFFFAKVYDNKNIDAGGMNFEILHAEQFPLQFTVILL